jgi:hypothetical protein
MPTGALQRRASFWRKCSKTLGFRKVWLANDAIRSVKGIICRLATARQRAFVANSSSAVTTKQS